MKCGSRNRCWKVGFGGVAAAAVLALTIGGCPLLEDEFAAEAALFSSEDWWGWDGSAWDSTGWDGGGAWATDAGYNYSGIGGGIGSDGETFYFIDGDSSYISP